ncbi:ATP-binding protein [bacterium]|jgi:two-component system, NtrC family, sensor kinase|nr:ATP-binding protein [bacterium]|eukprot:COSAG01_NODE_336_length_18685_cov_122.103357_18_plen_283_part_00
MEGSLVSDGQQNEIQHLRNEIDALKKQLDQSQRMTALGELVSTTTHEFNNVLMTIINYAKMGMRHDDKQTRDKAFDKINNAGMRAAKITNAVLGMARNRSEHFELTDVSKLIDESMVLLEREMQKYRISVDIDIDKDIPEISAIGNQVQQVLMNLLINARQAMSEGGQLVIKLKKNLQNNTVDLSVRDYGPGISQEKLRKIFDPFYSTKSGPDETGKGGTGVGLSTCKNIIEAHGGKIRVESSLGKGTCFTLMFPMEKQKSPVQLARGISGAVSQINATTGT